MKKWLTDNLLALIVILLSGIGTYNLAINRILVLETIITKDQVAKQNLRLEVHQLQDDRSKIMLDAATQHTALREAIKAQDLKINKSDEIIENNTKVMNSIYLLVTKIDTNLENNSRRLERVEKRLEEK